MRPNADGCSFPGVLERAVYKLNAATIIKYKRRMLECNPRQGNFHSYFTFMKAKSFFTVNMWGRIEAFYGHAFVNRNSPILIIRQCTLAVKGLVLRSRTIKMNASVFSNLLNSFCYRPAWFTLRATVVDILTMNGNIDVCTAAVLYTLVS